MEIVLEIIFQILAEIFMQLVYELGFHSMLEPFNKKPKPVIAFIGYLVLGVIAGFISKIFTPQLLIKGETLRVINLLVTPIAVGLIMSALGKLREKNGVSLIRMDKFLYGFIFAFSMALVRYLYING